MSTWEKGKKAKKGTQKQRVTLKMNTTKATKTRERKRICYQGLVTSKLNVTNEDEKKKYLGGTTLHSPLPKDTFII